MNFWPKTLITICTWEWFFPSWATMTCPSSFKFYIKNWQHKCYRWIISFSHLFWLFLRSSNGQRFLFFVVVLYEQRICPMNKEFVRQTSLFLSFVLIKLLQKSKFFCPFELRRKSQNKWEQGWTCCSVLRCQSKLSKLQMWNCNFSGF